MRPATASRVLRISAGGLLGHHHGVLVGEWPCSGAAARFCGPAPSQAGLATFLGRHHRQGLSACELAAEELVDPATHESF